MASNCTAVQHQHKLGGMKTKVWPAPSNDVRATSDQSSSPAACTGHMLDLLISAAHPGSPLQCSTGNMDMLMSFPACKGGMQDRSPVASAERGHARRRGRGSASSIGLYDSVSSLPHASTPCCASSTPSTSSLSSPAFRSQRRSVNGSTATSAASVATTRSTSTDRPQASGVSGDLAYAGTMSTGCAPICAQDLSLARLLCTLADSTHGNPALMLQHLLGFTADDYNDLLSALSESGCSYVDILAAYLHNLRIMTQDAAADPAAATESLQQRISDMHTELVADMVSKSLQGPSAQQQQQSRTNAAPIPAPKAVPPAQDSMAMLQAMMVQVPVAPAPAQPATMDMLAQLLAGAQMMPPPVVPQRQQPAQECLESVLLQLLQTQQQVQVEQQAMQQMFNPAAYLMGQPTSFAHCDLQMPQQQQLSYPQLMAAQQQQQRAWGGVWGM